METREYQFWLNSIPGVGAVRVHTLLNHFGDACSVYHAGREAWGQVIGTRKNILDAMENSRDERRIQNEFESMVKKEIRMIEEQDVDYPEALFKVYDRPNVIFVKGKLPDPQKLSIGIVGARECSDYGQMMARQFARELSDCGVQVISGMARGIDGIAHAGALEGKSPTYAVLGNGVDICYPASHITLREQILKQGGLLSEFVPGTIPRAANFPMRNRLISAFSDGLLVIEAREKSGSLITVSMALEQGVDVFAVPGRVYDGLSIGCNQLIQQGANLVQNAKDILEYFHLDGHKIATKSKMCEIMLETNEKMLYDCLSLEPLHMDTIVKRTGLSVPEAVEIAWNLECRDLICQVRQNYYVRKPEGKGE